jgi:hypothetical protein
MGLFAGFNFQTLEPVISMGSMTFEAIIVEPMNNIVFWDI